MPSFAARDVTGYQPGSPRQRLVSSLLSAAIIVIALLIAIYQTTVAPERKQARNPVTFNIEGNDSDNGTKAPESSAKAETTEKEPPRQSSVQVEAPVQPAETPISEQEKPAFSFLKLSRSEMAASDIGGMRRSGSGSAELAKGGGGSSYGPGEGPGGAVLYNADWLREPTDAELAGYLPPKAPSQGWGAVACQTIARNRVENCQILGESPRGSGFGRAVLNAAWQFRVIPPRVNGKPQVGEWVRIRIDYGITRET